MAGSSWGPYCQAWLFHSSCSILFFILPSCIVGVLVVLHSSDAWNVVFLLRTSWRNYIIPPCELILKLAVFRRNLMSLSICFRTTAYGYPVDKPNISLLAGIEICRLLLRISQEKSLVFYRGYYEKERRKDR